MLQIRVQFWMYLFFQQNLALHNLILFKINQLNKNYNHNINNSIDQEINLD